MSKSYEEKFFHCYATANDKKLFFWDLLNLLRIQRNPSGVKEIQLYIAISKAKPVSSSDKIFVRVVKSLFKKHPNVNLRKIFFKENSGRDFSSYGSLKRLVEKEASAQDYVFFQNRSGYGPFRKGWYKMMIAQFEKYETTALCGSTINFKDHPLRSNRSNVPHVQTYAFLTKFNFLQMLGDDFPGEKEDVRLNIILKGEIELSQFFIRKGYGITCIEWPEEIITNDSTPRTSYDIKKNVVQDHSFYHRTFFSQNWRSFKWMLNKGENQ